MLGDDVVSYSKLRDGVAAHWRRDETTGQHRWMLDEKRASIDSHIDENIVVPLLGHVKAAAEQLKQRIDLHIATQGIAASQLQWRWGECQPVRRPRDLA